MPYIAQVAVGRRDHLSVYGDDYNTPDGTGVRDYIHVVDLARGHVCAIEYMMKHRGENVFNLGTGTGYSVLDMVHAFERVTGVKIPYEIGRAARETSPRYTPAPTRARSCWAGRPSTIWTTCAGTPGPGSPRTPWATTADRCAKSPRIPTPVCAPARNDK